MGRNGKLNPLLPLPFSPIPSDGLDQWIWALRRMPAGSLPRRRRVQRIVTKILNSRFKLEQTATVDLPCDTKPYLTSAQILYSSDVIVERYSNRDDVVFSLMSFSGKSAKVAVHTSRLWFILELLGEALIDSSNWQVFVIRGNSFFDRRQIEDYDFPFKKIYLHNLLGPKKENSAVSALPLGANVNFVSDLGYLDSLRSSKIPGLDGFAPDRHILSNFDCSTNFTARSNAVIALRNNPLVTRIEKISPDKIIETTREFMFTLSPPGAGPDCYRTWEAIIAGSIPIVLEESTPEFDFPFPIWRIGHFEEINRLTSDDLLEKYHQIKSSHTILPHSTLYSI